MDSRSSSASAVKFEGITCDNCGRREILGTRWKCELCFDYDLCDDCYKMGMHYRDHPFLLLKRPDEAAERVPPRTTSGRVPSSPISESGLIFYGITCDACGKNNISGVRWMCDECFDYDLCSVCYAANKHDNHTFVRFDRPRGKGVRVSPRKMSAGVESGGVVHEGINCDACGERGIYGTRWKCLLCFDFDLCNACYARGRHDQEHAFLSLEKPGGVAKTVPPRKTTFMPQVCYLKPGGPRFDCVSCNFCHDSCSGPRWKCEVCTDYDLCSKCYLSNVHDLDHAFVRFDGPRSRGVRVRPRHQSTDTEELEAMLHEGIRCDACGEAGIYGKRWKCQFCYAYDLCTACYMSGKHNGEHPFLRIDRAGGVA